MLSAADRELRKGRITSSTAAAVLGLSTWMSPLAAWVEIVSGTADEDDEDEDEKKESSGGDAEDEEIRAEHERGHFLEPALCDWARHRLAAEVGCDLELVRPPTIVHPHESWAADSVDGLLVRRLDSGGTARFATVEAKSVAGGLDAWGEAGTAQVPPYVEIQARWHAWAYDVPVTYVPMLGPRLSLALYVVPRNADIEEALVETTHDWWHWHVEGGRQPEATGADEAVLRRLFPRHREKSLIRDDPALALLCRQDVELRESLAAAKESRKAVRAEIMDRLRDAEGAKGDGYSISWRTGKPKASVDWQAVARELGASDELIERHTRSRTNRILRTSWSPKEDA